MPPSDTPSAPRPAAISAGAIGRRAALGIALLALMSGGTAALLYNSLDPEVEFAADRDAVRRRTTLTAVTSWSRSGDAGQADLAAGNATGLIVLSAKALIDQDTAAAQLTVTRLQAASEDGGRRPILAALTVGETALQDAFSRETTLIDQLIARGVDGIFLNCRQALAVARQSGRGAQSKLAEALGALADRVRTAEPDFLIVLENAPSLTAEPSIARVVDGIAVNSLLYAADGSGAAGARSEIAEVMPELNRVKRSGRAVFVTEYLAETAIGTRAGALQVLRGLGFLARFSSSIAAP